MIEGSKSIESHEKANNSENEFCANSKNHESSNEMSVEYIDLLRTRVHDCQNRCAQLMAATDQKLKESCKGFSQETRTTETQEVLTRSESGIDCSNHSRDETGTSPHSRSAPTLDFKVLEQFEQAATNNLELSKDIEQLLTEWRRTRTFLDYGADYSWTRDSEKHFQELIALKFKYNSEKSQWLERLNELTVQNEKKRQLLMEKEQIISSLSRSMESSSQPIVNNSYNRSATHMYKALMDIGQFIIQEAEHSMSDDSSFGRNSAFVKLKEMSMISKADELEDQEHIPSDLCEAIVSSLKTLTGRRRMEMEDTLGKYNASKEQIRIQKKFIDQTSEERQKLLKINAQLTNQVTELNRDLVFNSSRTSTPSASNKGGSPQAVFLDHVKANLKEQIEALNNENEKLHCLANDFRKGRELMEDELEEMRSKERSYRWEADQRKRDLDRLEKQLENSRREVVNLKAELSASQLTTETLEKNYEDVSEKLQQFRRQKDELENELTFVKSSEMALRSSVKSEQLHNQELTEQLEKVTQNLHQAKENYAKLVREKQEVDAVVRQNEAKLSELQETCESLAQRRRKLEQDLRDCQESDECHKQLYEDLKSETTKQFGVLGSEINELTKQLDDLSFENEKLKQERNSLKTQLQELIRSKEAAADSIRKLQQQLAATEEEVRAFADQVKTLKISKSELERQKDALNSHISQLQEEMNLLNATLAKTADENQELHIVKVNLINKLNVAQKEYEQRIANEQQVLEEMRHDFERQRVSMEARNEELISQMKVEKERCIGDYQEQLSRLKMELKLMENELNEKVNCLEREKLNSEIMHKKTVNSLNEKLDQITKAIEQKEMEITQLAGNLRDTRQKMHEIICSGKAAEQKLGNDLNDLNKTVQDLTDQLVDASNKIKSLEEQNFEYESQNNQLEEEKRSLLQNLHKKNSRLKEIEEDCLQKESSIRALEEQIRALEQDVLQKDRDINQMHSDLVVQEEENTRLSNLVSDCDIKIKDVEANNEELVNELEEIRKTLMDVEKSRLELKKHVGNANVIQKTLENELNSKKAEVNEITLTLQKCEEKYRKKQEETQKQRQSIVELEAQVQTLRTESANVRHKLRECEHLLNLEKTTSRKSEEQLKRVDREKRSTEAKLVKTEEDLTLSRKSLKTAEQSLAKIRLEASRLSDEKAELERKLNRLFVACEESILPRVTEVHVDMDMDINYELLLKSLLDFVTEYDRSVVDRDELCKKYKALEENTRKLKTKLMDLEEQCKNKEKSTGRLAVEMEKLKKQCSDQEEDLTKLREEKKYLCGRLAQICAQLEKVEKERKRLLRENQNIQNINSSQEKELEETKNSGSEMIKKLEDTKCSLDERVATLMKQVNDGNAENETLRQEVKTLKKAVRSLQSNNLQLHTALSDSNIALQRSTKGEKELKRRVTSMSENIEENHSISRDVMHQLSRLKQQIADLTTERESLQQSLQSQRNVLQNLKETNRVLNIRVKQLEAELNLSVTKLNENQVLLQSKMDAATDREAKIKELERDCAQLQEKNKQLLLQQKTLLRSTPKNKQRSAAFLEETDTITQGLAALEEENLSLQRKVKSLQSLVNETESPTDGDLSKLRKAQLQAQSLLEVRERTHKKHVDSLESEISCLKEHLSSCHLSATPCLADAQLKSHTPFTSTPKDNYIRRKLKY